MSSSAASVFQHPKTVKEIALGNQSVFKESYHEVQAHRSITGDNGSFQTGIIKFNASVDGGEHAYFPRSYFSMKVKLTDANDVKLVDQEVALAQNLAAQLFQSAEVRIGGQTVSLCDRNLAETDIVMHRLHDSRSWQESVGESLSLLGMSYANRKALTAAAGSSELEIIWVPRCLSMWQYKAGIPASDIEVILNPYSGSTFQKNAVQTAVAAFADYKFHVTDMRLQLQVLSSDKSVLDKEYILELPDVISYDDRLPNNTGGSVEFTVPTNTNAVSEVFYDRRQESDTTIPRGTFHLPGAGGTYVGKKERALVSHRMVYAKIEKPSPRYDISYAKGTLKRVWADTLLNSGRLFSTGGSETYQEWLDRGPIIHAEFVKNFSLNRDKRLLSDFTLSEEADANNGAVMIFAHYTRVFRVVVKSGKVQQVLEAEL